MTMRQSHHAMWFNQTVNTNRWSSSGFGKLAIIFSLLFICSSQLFAFQGSGQPSSYYTPPKSKLLNHSGYLSPASSEAPLTIALEFLRGHATDLNLKLQDLDNYVVTDNYTSRGNGVTHIYLRQLYNNLPVINAAININISNTGRVINVGCSFVPGLPATNQFLPPTTAVSATQALESLASHFGLTLNPAPTIISSFTATPERTTLITPSGISRKNIPAKLCYVPTPDGDVELAWNVNVDLVSGDSWYDANISAVDGDILYINNWVAHADYNVYPFPGKNPDDVARSIQTDPHDSFSSPYGWHDIDGFPGAEFTVTRGNNVHATDDRDGDNFPGFSPDGGGSLSFNFPINLATESPVDYISAAITNLFYWNNIIHDILYHYGFDEASGNFQQTNYDGMGLGGDPVLADAQDAADFGFVNNANFATPPDGTPPRMQMFEFTFTTPRRDSDLSNEIIIHEYGHGVSNRLTGGPSNSNALSNIQSGAMGEGWSDWWSLMLTQKTTDAKLAAYPSGTYVLGQAQNGPGIRNYPYSFDKSINPLTYGQIGSLNLPHGAGEVWCSVLWDLTWLLVDEYGFDPDLIDGAGGNNVALQLVMDGLKLQPANPSFLDARDAILQADTISNDGDNHEFIWKAFARRGMGLNASDGGSSNSLNVTEAFNAPFFGEATVPTLSEWGLIVLGVLLVSIGVITIRRQQLV